MKERSEKGEVGEGRGGRNRSKNNGILTSESNKKQNKTKLLPAPLPPHPLSRLSAASFLSLLSRADLPNKHKLIWERPR